VNDLRPGRPELFGRPVEWVAAVACLAVPLALAACGRAGGAPASSSNSAGSATAAIDCAAEPRTPVTAFLEGEHERVVHLEGVRFAGPPEGRDFPVYPLTSRDGRSHRLTVENLRLPAGGGPYDLTVEYVMGMPSPSALVLMDTAGLVFAAASDHAPRARGAVERAVGANVLRDGLPAWTLRLVDAGCRSRPVGKCYAARVNLALEVTHAGTTHSLGNGQSVDLDGYRVTCHAAERVEYTSACADAGVLGVSWSISRED
jgi:hypothetical protein